MTSSIPNHRSTARRVRSRAGWVTALVALFLLGILVAVLGGAAAAATSVSLGTAEPFAILAGTEITDVPPSPITGDVGVSPASGTFIGVSCAEVTGTIYSVDASGPLPCRVTDPGLLTTAKADMSTAYTDAAGRTPDTTFTGTDNQLGGQVLVPGVYRIPHASTANLIGNVTLSGTASDIWIFQATSDLVTASSSTVTFTGGAQACNVFWQVGSAATLGSSSSFAGTILAGTSIGASTGATIDGRLLASAAVTLDHNTITKPTCAAAPSTTTATTTAPTTTVTTTARTTTARTTTPRTTTAVTTAAATTTAATTTAATTTAATTTAETTTAATTSTPATTAATTTTTAQKTAASKTKAASKKKVALKKKRSSSTQTTFARRSRHHVGLTG